MSLKQSLADTSKSIKDLLKTLEPDIEEISDLETKVSITGITNDSRKVSKGDIFVAYKGINDDGHKYIQEAIEKGAGAIIAEKSINNSRIPYVKVKDGRNALAKVSAVLNGHPSNKMKVTGITGTNGKTTTTFILDHILKCDGKKTGLLGTVYNKISDKCIMNSSMTTLTAPELHRTLKDMYESKVNYVNMEVSSHSLKEKRVDGVDFNIAGITNFSFDHLDYHPSRHDYFLSKSRLFKLLEPEDFAIFNADDPILLDFCNRTKAKIITYSLDYEHPMIKVSNLVLKGNTSEFSLKVNEDITTLNDKIIYPGNYSFSLPLPGKHNVYNAVLATISACILGVNLHDISEYLTTFKGLFRRFEPVYTESYNIIDDFAHNPASIKAALETVGTLTYNSLILVFGIRGGRGTKINERNAQTLSMYLNKLAFKKLIVTCCEDVDENTDTYKASKVNDSEARAFFKSLTVSAPGKISSCQNLEPALKEALDLAKKNDIILILGGHGMDNAQAILKELI